MYREQNIVGKESWEESNIKTSQLLSKTEHRFIYGSISKTKDFYLHSLNRAREHRAVGDILLVQ